MNLTHNQRPPWLVCFVCFVCFWGVFLFVCFFVCCLFLFFRLVGLFLFVFLLFCSCKRNAFHKIQASRHSPFFENFRSSSSFLQRLSTTIISFRLLCVISIPTNCVSPPFLFGKSNPLSFLGPPWPAKQQRATTAERQQNKTRRVPTLRLWCLNCISSLQPHKPCTHTQKNKILCCDV